MTATFVSGTRQTPPCLKASDAGPNHIARQALNGSGVTTSSAAFPLDECGTKSSTDWWIVGLTGALVLIGTGQFLMFQQQLSAMQSSLADSARASRAATRQALAAEAALKVVERSYLSVDNWLVVNFHPDTPVGRAAVMFQYINSGRIPAEITGVRLNYKIGFDIPEIPEFDDKLKVGHSVIRPFGISTQPLRFTAAITQEEYDRTISREWCIFAWGKVSYTDNFKQPHETGFAAKAVYQGNDDKGVPQWRYEFVVHPAYTYST